MKKYLILSLALITLACTKEPIESSRVITEPVLEGNVNLAAPAVGQKSLFLRYYTQCEDLDGLFEYTGDTLQVEVIEESGQMLIRETFTEFSTSMLNGGIVEPLSYPISCDGKKVLIPEREQSHLFFFYGNDTIRLETNMDVDLAQRDCKLFDSNDVFIGDDIGYLETFQLGSMEQKSKIAVSCVPVITLDAYLIYDKQQLHVSHVIYTSNFMGNISQSIQGWELIN